MIKKIFLLITLISSILILKNYELVKINIIEACNLFLKNIFPSIFPMLIISTLLLNLNFIKILNIFFKKINQKIFNISNNQSYILFMSMLSGFPSNAKISKELYEKEMVSKTEIQKIILFTHFANPIFILNMTKHHKILVLIAHYLGNIIIALLTKKIYIEENNKSINSYNNKNNKELSNIFFESITTAINTSLYILGTIVTFYIISSLFNHPLLNIILELSQGINKINLLHMSIKFKTILIGSLLSFGGICIHFQVYGILSNIKIKYYPYLICRIIHATITGLIIFIFYK